MKKSIFLLAAGALALTACTSEEILESGNQGNVIGFENAVCKQTKADVKDLDYGTLKLFNVFGYYTAPNNTVKAIGVFNNQEVKKVDGAWSYGDYRYWVPGGKYYFYAYSCNNAPISEDFYGDFSLDLTAENETARALRINSYKCDENHQHDLIFASAGPIIGKGKGEDVADVFKGTNDAVSLKFNHLLSKVNATFSSKFPESYNVEISDVRLEGVRNIGSYNSSGVTGGTWTTKVEENTTPKVYLWKNADEKTDTNTTGCLVASGSTIATTNSAYVLPYIYNKDDENSTTVEIKFNVEIKDQKTGESVLVRHMHGEWGPTWEIGHKYTYNIEISGTTTDLEAIVFVVEVDENGTEPVSGWGEGQSINLGLSAN